MEVATAVCDVINYGCVYAKLFRQRGYTVNLITPGAEGKPAAYLIRLLVCYLASTEYSLCAAPFGSTITIVSASIAGY